MRNKGRVIACMLSMMLLTACNGVNQSGEGTVTPTNEPAVETVKETVEEKEESDGIRLSPIGSRYYAGYLDEFEGWKDHVLFTDQDYDNDGKVDRVYREVDEENDQCTYRFEMGDGTEFTTGAVDAVGTPHVECLDWKHNGSPDLLFTQNYFSDKHSAPSCNGRVLYFTKKNDQYELTKLAGILYSGVFKKNLKQVRLSVTYTYKPGGIIKVRTTNMLDFHKWTIDVSDVMESCLSEDYHGQEFKVLCNQVDYPKGENGTLDLHFPMIHNWNGDEAVMKIGYVDGKLKIVDVECGKVSGYEENCIE